ncbi:Transducin family protein / WD-40 repeat family protein isoform 1 [Hibiscus syriacus]|uniref:Transducin family protein / WD-40 repeat family protein isoform 1 n=1 Tax=Hibiscus syriacus TaxID=106335 RepID=A0A6A2YQ40_HIBSY|nr:Transducin family protein / WD-40 repeat family protein isoform 1 [Hibiscus syriacus]
MAKQWGMKVGSCALFLAALLQCRFLGFAILDLIDFLALQSIRKSLHDLPCSNFFASWDLTSDPCNFTGVYCESDRVVAPNLGYLRAGSPGLIGRIDSTIGKLFALVELSIVPGRIYGSLSVSISQLNGLRFLVISRNFISWNILLQLRRLKTIDLSYNQLAGGIPHSIGTLLELTNVILCHIHLSGSVPPFRSQVLT